MYYQILQLSTLLCFPIDVPPITFPARPVRLHILSTHHPARSPAELCCASFQGAPRHGASKGLNGREKTSKVERNLSLADEKPLLHIGPGKKSGPPNNFPLKKRVTRIFFTLEPWTYVQLAHFDTNDVPSETHGRWMAR